jgi:hypothetical protein
VIARAAALAALILALTGCAGQSESEPMYSAWYVHSETRTVVHCTTPRVPMFVWVSVGSYANCKTRLENEGFQRESASSARAKCAQWRCYNGTEVYVSASVRCYEEGLRGEALTACAERRTAEALQPPTGEDCAPSEYWSASAGACAPREP